jgi:hypothetical protein
VRQDEGFYGICSRCGKQKIKYVVIEGFNANERIAKKGDWVKVDGLRTSTSYRAKEIVFSDVNGVATFFFDKKIVKLIKG